MQGVEEISIDLYSKHYYLQTPKLESDPAVPRWVKGQMKGGTWQQNIVQLWQWNSEKLYNMSEP